ncbi:ATP-dependent helicase [Pseudomonas sp. PSB1]|nr:ATP-dependent helicase [Pseudomonas sp. PSB1]
MAYGIERIGTISQADVERACLSMGLPSDAFSGPDGDDPRLEVIRSLDTLDVEACPGSGKTTLLVAKLGILADRWQQKGQGICVISHTNAARAEIGARLSTNSTSYSLLQHPHFIGTIHSFVNEFLALPWLRSNGKNVKIIDTELAEKDRRWRLPYGTRTYLENQYEYTPLIYTKPDFSGNRHPPHTATAKSIQKACRESTAAGFYCFDEMFVWAYELINKHPEVITTIRQRFPLVLVDEVQDNSRLQSEFIHKLFCDGDAPSIWQRYGDSNQAIYGGTSTDTGGTTHPFPGTNKIDLPNSFRFGQSIASIAAPLGLRPQPLIGRGPTTSKINHPSCQNAIFLFDDQSILQVLPTYAQYLIDAFTPEALVHGDFTAVAAVHRSDKTDKLPRFMGHYAPDYTSQLAGQQPKPSTLGMYLACARMELSTAGSTSPVVNRFAEGILHAIHLSTSDFATQTRKSPHRHVLELLSEHDAARHQYQDALEYLIACKSAPKKSEWPEFTSAIKAIAGTIARVEIAEHDNYFEWTDSEAFTDAIAVGPLGRENRFLYPGIDPKVTIRLGSIHGVKGETHTATLVLESFQKAHQLKTLIPWLTGKKPKISTDNTGENSALMERLKLHYVAMTRPSHLLCLALRKDALKDRELDLIRKTGWTIIDCTSS